MKASLLSFLLSAGLAASAPTTFTPFSCPSTPFVVRTNALYSFDPATSRSTLIETGYGLPASSSGTMYALGYNVQDNFLYGVTYDTNSVVRISSNNLSQQVSTLPVPSYGWSAGVVDDSNQFWVFSGISQYAQVDVSSNAVVATGNVNAPTYINDWVFMPGGGRALWTVNVLNGALALLRFDMSTKQFTTAATYGLLTGNTATNFVAMFAINSTVFEAIDGTTRQAWRFDVTGATAPVQVTSVVDGSIADAARCLNGLNAVVSSTSTTSSATPTKSSTTQTTTSTTSTQTTISTAQTTASTTSIQTTSSTTSAVTASSTAQVPTTPAQTTTSAAQTSSSAVQATSSTASAPVSTVPATAGQYSCPASNGTTFTSNGRTYTITCGQNLYGNVIDGSNGLTLDQCISSCSGLSTCTSATFIPAWNNACYRRTGTQQASQDSTAYNIVEAAQYSCPASDGQSFTSNGRTFTVACGANVQGGSIISSTNGGSFDQCTKSCSASSTCTASVFIPTWNNACYLYSGAVTQVADSKAWTVATSQVASYSCPASDGKAFTSSGGRSFKLSCGYNVRGGIVTSGTNGGTLDQCTQSCLSLSSCSASVFIPTWNNACYLYSGPVTQVADSKALNVADIAQSSVASAVAPTITSMPLSATASFCATQTVTQTVSAIQTVTVTARL